MTADEHSAIAQMTEALTAAQFPCWPHNAAVTQDIESLRSVCLAYSAWWNNQAMPAIEAARQIGLAKPAPAHAAQLATLRAASPMRPAYTGREAPALPLFDSAAQLALI